MSFKHSILDVTTYSDEPSFSSFEGALSEPRGIDRRSRARVDSLRFKGVSIIEATYSDRSLSLLFDTKDELRFFVDEAVVSWEITERANRNKTYQHIDAHQLASPVQLRFPNVSEHVSWNQGELVSTFINKQFVAFSASSAWVFLTIRDVPELMLSRIGIPSLRKDVLFFYPT